MTTTTVFMLAGQQLSADRMAGCVPPQTGALPLAPLDWKERDERLCSTLELPAAALAELRQILPCFSCSAARGYRFTLEYRLPGEDQAHKIDLEPIGDFRIEAPPAADAAVEADVDLLVVRQPLECAVLHLEVIADDLDALRAVPALLSVSLRLEGNPPLPAPAPPGDAVELEVPARSQMVLAPELASRVCSPTCLSMLLGFYGHETDVYEVIRQARHAPSGMHGVWPANVQATAAYGMLGYLLHFPSWEAARWLLDCRVPIIASVRYERGELAGAAVERTAGHLVLLRGYRDNVVRVNDPAAASDGEVVREYDLEEWVKIWLGRTAVGYVIFPLDRVGA